MAIHVHKTERVPRNNYVDQSGLDRGWVGGIHKKLKLEKLLFVQKRSIPLSN